MKKLYAMAERCVVCSMNDGDGLENDPEPVICIQYGVHSDKSIVQDMVDKANAEYAYESRAEWDQHYVVVELQLNEP